MTTPQLVPFVAPFSQIQTADCTAAILYSATMVLQVNTRTSWLTPCTGLDNGDGSWTFTTQSAWFRKQISVTLKGNFDIGFSAIETLFGMDRSSWAALVAFDQTHAKLLNEVFQRKWQPFTQSLWGHATALNINNMPAATTDITPASYEATIVANICDFPFTWLYQLQVLAYVISVLVADPTNINALALLQLVQPDVLLVINGVFNVNRQLSTLGKSFVRNFFPDNCGCQ